MLVLRSVAVAFRVFAVAFALSMVATPSFASDDVKTSEKEEFDYEYLKKSVEDRTRAELLLVNYQFYDFVENLSLVPRERAQTAFHILRRALDTYIAYSDKIVTDKQASIVLDEIRRISKAGNEYFASQNNEIAARYFVTLQENLPERLLGQMNAADTRRSEIIDTTKTQMFKLNEDAILKNNIEYKVDIKTNEVTTVEYKDTVLELSVRELPMHEPKGNVITLASKEAPRRVFSLRVLEPSQDVSEALLLTTKHLLSHPKVSGVLFDDRLRVPSEMQNIAHERRSLGERVLLVRPICSGLFSSPN